METIKKLPAEAELNLAFPNEVLKVIYERRAVRRYKDRPVKKGTIDSILDAGRMAPSAINKQPWKFYILTNKEDIHLFSKEIAKVVLKGVVQSGLKGIVKTAKEFLHFSHSPNFLNVSDPIFHGAPVVIFISSDRSNEWAALDIGMCAQNMMLAAKSFGLDTCPVGMGKFVGKTKICEKLKIPEGDQVNLAIVLGYGNEIPDPKQRVSDNAFYF
jgi:nitroreductase